MLNLDLQTIATWTGGRLRGANARITSVSTDSRKLVKGALFVALRGEHHDAHDHVAEAKAAGAIAALVEREIAFDFPQVVVADTERALGDLAAGVRRQRDVCIIGITGSNGKTTVKTLLASILSRHAQTHVNSGSFNNEIGLPLTLLAMPAESEYAVLEMGAGKPGDIDYLVRIAQPRIGLVNNIAPAHLERMGTVDGIAETKGALYAGLPDDGIAIINADDAYAGFFARLAGARRVLRFGLGGASDVTAHFDDVQAQNSFTLVAPAGEIRVDLNLRGRHNVLNALAAATVAVALDVRLATIKAGLESATAVAGRTANRLHPSGAEVIDDSYNANPASFSAAVATLASATGQKILVVGDMRELGPDGQRLHAELGALARKAGINRLYAVGELSRAAATAFGPEALHFADQPTLITALRAELVPGATVLIKGSRGSAMDRVVIALMAIDEHEGERHVA